jgi:protein SCO1/2
MRRLLFLVGIFLLTACGASPPEPFGDTDITGADFGRSLTDLKDQHQQPRTLADFKGKAVLVFFGYTSCPDVCPTTLSRFARVMTKLGDDAEKVQVLLITVDPERDTPEKLGPYVEAFNPKFLALYGDMAATQANAKELKVFFAKTKPAAGEAHHHHEGMDMSAEQNYMIDHTAGAYAFDPQGRIRLYIKDDASDEVVAEDLKRLLAGA